MSTIEYIIGVGVVSAFSGGMYWLRKKAKKDDQKKLKDGLDGYMKQVSRLPKGVYVILSGDELAQREAFQENALKIREVLDSQNYRDLWKSVPKGPTRIELKLKENRIRQRLEEL